MSNTVKLLISGRVQGVFFRKYTQQKAHELGVLGTVRNLADGRVEVIAQADDVNLEAFLQCCHQGPMMARVDKVEIEKLTNPLENQDFNSFEII